MRVKNFETVIRRNPVLDVIMGPKSDWRSIEEYESEIRTQVSYVAVRPFRSMHLGASDSPLSNDEGDWQSDSCYMLYFRLPCDRKIGKRSRMVLEIGGTVYDLISRLYEEYSPKLVTCDVLLKLNRSYLRGRLMSTGYDAFIFPEEWTIPKA